MNAGEPFGVSGSRETQNRNVFGLIRVSRFPIRGRTAAPVAQLDRAPDF